jgi:hypothetical protein
MIVILSNRIQPTQTNSLNSVALETTLNIGMRFQIRAAYYSNGAN